MASMLESLIGTFGGDAIQKISQQLGTNPAQAQQALSAALPALLGGLAKNASTPQGAADLHAAVTSDHDGSILNNVAAAMQNPATGDGNAILGHILGGRQQAVEGAIARATGLDQAKVATLLPMLAPVVMGYVGRMQQQQGLNAGGLSKVLGEAGQLMSGQVGGVMGSLLQALDANHDGSVVDEAVGALGKLFGKH